MKPVKDIKIRKGDNVKTIIKKMGEAGGFNAKHLYDACEVLKEMQKPNVLRFLSFPADIIATGTRGIIRDMIKNKMFDVVITTCGTLDHDIARSFKNYYHGSFWMDDVELAKKDIHRIGNVLTPKESYGIPIEKFLKKVLPEIYAKKKELASYEFCWELGKKLKKDSILYWSWKNKIPVIVPGITDGAVGYHLWEFWQDHKDFGINVLKDEQLLSDLVWNAKKSGALILGGGISKHHTIWWNQFKDGLDYAVYITTATEYDGSLSGARPEEAISWHKIRVKAKKVFLMADVTIVLPFIYAYLL